MNKPRRPSLTQTCNLPPYFFREPPDRRRAFVDGRSVHNEGGVFLSMFVSLSTQRRRWLWIALSLAAATLLLAACGGAATTPAPTATTAPTTAPTPTPTPATTPTPVAIVHVKIVENEDTHKYAFMPATLTVKVGTEVVWTNISDAPHTVTSDTGAFNTPSNLMMNQTFMMIFSQVGTFKYHCNIHAYMMGTIMVTS